MYRTYVYIDGFNLYYGAVKQTPFKWLNVRLLTQNLVKKANIQKVKYFSAIVSARPDDPSQPTRQQVFLNALETIPDLEIIYGNFQTKKAFMLSARKKDEYHFVWRTEEKGSDVNLAVQMLHDAHLNRYDQAILISNDSDLSEAVRLVSELGKKVLILNPFGNKTTQRLKEHAFFHRPIRLGAVQDAQFPDPINHNGTKLYKPRSWNTLVLNGHYAKHRRGGCRMQCPKLKIDFIAQSKTAAINILRSQIKSKVDDQTLKFAISTHANGRLKVTFDDWGPVVDYLKSNKRR